MAEPQHSLDSIDVKIVDLLVEDGRRTLADLGAQIGLSAPAVKRRLERLEESGVITGYTAKVDHRKLGRSDRGIHGASFRGTDQSG